jgi:polysaccharide biosynthesis PFTS motif protein
MMSILRKAMIGYDALKDTSKLSKISDIKLELTNTRLHINGKISKLIFGKGISHYEIIVRQYLLSTFADIDFNKILLSAYSQPANSAVLQLPQQWCNIVSNHGIKVSRLKSKILWNVFLVKYLYRQYIFLSRELFNSILQILDKRPIPKMEIVENYAYFFWLTQNALPQTDINNESNDIVSWYSKRFASDKAISVIYHSVPNASLRKVNNIDICHIHDPILPLFEKKAIKKYMFWCLGVVLSSVFHLILGRWWNIILIGEATQAVKTKYQKDGLLAREYLFNNSGWIYRPLWTYEAIAKGSEITFYFYSTNCEGFATEDHTTKFVYGYQAMNWPNYLVWDSYQADFIKRAVGKSFQTMIVGPIPFSWMSINGVDILKNSIAVFDVQPMRDAVYKTLGLDFEYYVPRNCNRFLLDIYDVCERAGFNMVLKRKRDLGRRLHPSYRNEVKKLNKLPNFQSVNPELPADIIIANADAIISMPFTSTAILGRQAGKPSVYYDPFNMLQKDDQAAHGIQIISGIEELRIWVNSTINSPN